MELHPHCCRYLYGFEVYGKAKGRGSGPKDSPGRGRKRGQLETEGGGGEEGGGDVKLQRVGSSEDVKPESVEQRGTRSSKQMKEGPLWRDGHPSTRDVPSSLFPTSSSSLSSPVRGSVVGGRDTRPSPVAAGAGGGGGRGANFTRGDLNEKAGSPSVGVVECKSEPSDHESYPGDTTSSTTGEEGEEGGRGDTWAQREPQRFAENDRVLVWYGAGKNTETYEAKIIGMEESENRRDYLVHYSGWNNRSVYSEGFKAIVASLMYVLF